MSLPLEAVSHPDKNLGYFRFKKMPTGDYLLTNEVGDYSFLSVVEFEQLLSGKLAGEKRSELESKHFYKTPNYEEEMQLLYNQKNQFLAYGPSLHMIVTTLRCNHKCQYCHAAVAPMTAKELDMTEDTARKVVDTIFYSSARGVTIEFQGGESLVNWPIVQFIVEYATIKSSALKKSLTFALVSNLSLMDEEKLAWLLDHKVDICTSLDGDELTHNRQRIYKEGNSYEKVTYWIGRIREERIKRGFDPKHATIGALSTWTKTSIQDYKKIVDTYIELGILTIGFRWLNPYGFALAQREKLDFSYDEFTEFFRNGMDYILEKNKEGIKIREMISTVYLQKIFFHQDGGFMDIRSPSGVAIGGVAYNYDGKVYSGDESRMLGRMGIEDFLMTPMLETGEETYKAMANADITKIAVQSSTLDGLPGYNDHVYKPYLGVNVLYNFTEYGTPYSNFSKDEKNQMQVFILDYLFEKLRDPENEKLFRDWFR